MTTARNGRVAGRRMRAAMSDCQLFPLSSRGDAPTVSVIVPTFARPLKLRACLDALAALESSSPSFEVIVVDDGGPESLEPVVAGVADRLDVRLVRQARGGPAAARNTGASQARGRYLAFTDDDCAPASDWLVALVRELDRDDRQLLGGRVENALTSNPYSTASEHITQFVYEYNRTIGAHEPFFTTNNMALAADVFHSLGGFDTTIPSATAEDKEFCDRWRGRGLALTHVSTAVVYHAHSLTFSRFCRQHFNYGRGIMAFRLMRRRRVESTIVPEPLRFYARLVLSPLRGASPVGRWRLVALLVASQAATLVGAAREALTWRPLSRPGGGRC